MKPIYLILILVFGCTSKPENKAGERNDAETGASGDEGKEPAEAPMDLMRKLLEAAYKKGTYVETINGQKLKFDDSKAQGVDSYAEASYRKKGDMLLVTIEKHADMSSDNQSGIFIPEGDGWKSVFPEQLVKGVVDTLIDLDGNQTDEIIMKDRESQSAGANTVFALYSKGSSDVYQKLKVFAKHSEGYSIFNFDQDHKQIQSIVSYVPAKGKVLIHVEETYSWMQDAEKNESRKESRTVEYSWDGTSLRPVVNEAVFLIIHGKDIWVRDVPTTGKVVMKLNEGDYCKVLEKGKEETIHGVTDSWYRVEFNSKEGWVFGSQTSMKR